MDRILSQPWGGLGDNLQFSTLPELFSTQGDDVYISDKNVVRNQEIHDLVWGYNPFVKGISSKPANIGWVPELPLQKIEKSIVTNWEITHGFGIVHNHPKIYYKSQNTDRFSGVFIDLNFTSVSYDIGVQSFIQSLVQQFDNPRLIQFRHIVAKKTIDINLPTIKVDNIYEYCDLITSCDTLITLSSGGSVLASAIKQNREKPNIIELQHSANLHYIFDNVRYLKLSKL